MENNKQSYQDKSRKERILLDELFKFIYINEEYEIKYYHTPIEGYDIYDSIVTRFNKDTSYLKDTHIYEVKIRDTNYPDILLEKKKYLSLMKEAIKYKNGEPVCVLYVSCHPTGTYVFNLSKLNNIKWRKEYHNISTTEKSKGKELKEVTYLPVLDAKFFPDIKTLYIERLDREKNIDVVLKDQSQLKTLFSILFGNEEKPF